MTRALLLAMLAFGTLAAAPAQAEPGAPVMHRTAAGRLDASGWTDASSTRGHFATRLPCLYNDFSLDSNDAGEVTAAAETIGCQREDRTQFLATRGSYHGGETVAQNYFDRAISNPIFPGGTQNVTTFAGRPAIEVTAREWGYCLWSRVIRDGPDNIVLAVQAPEAICDQIQPMAATFFAALQIEARR